MGAEVGQYVDDPTTNLEFEDKVIQTAKRNKATVRKLLHMHTSRLLGILGYSTTESDVSRLDYAVRNFG